MEFRVYRNRRDRRWVVRRDGCTYGHYLDKEQALLDALDAAKDASESGEEVQVWDSSSNARLL